MKNFWAVHHMEQKILWGMGIRPNQVERPREQLPTKIELGSSIIQSWVLQGTYLWLPSWALIFKKLMYWSSILVGLLFFLFTPSSIGQLIWPHFRPIGVEFFKLLGNSGSCSSLLAFDLCLSSIGHLIGWLFLPSFFQDFLIYCFTTKAIFS